MYGGVPIYLSTSTMQCIVGSLYAVYTATVIFGVVECVQNYVH